MSTIDDDEALSVIATLLSGPTVGFSEAALTDDDKAAINQFSVLDFVKPHKKTQTKANTVFCPKTGLYRPPGAEVGQPAPRGRRTSSFFWDTRVGAWRLKQADVVHKEDAPCFFGKETQFPLTEISLTVSKHHGDVPNVSSACYCNEKDYE